MHPLLEFLALLAKVFYFCLEGLYRRFVPVPKRDIKGQNVLITGGGRGIGRCLAIAFSKEDANIILWDMDESGLKETAADLKIRGATVHTYVCDVTNKETVKQVAADVRRDVGDVDILVNNAGVLVGKYIMDLTEADIRKTYEVNTISHFWTVQEFLPAMMKNRQGHIITIASMAARLGTPMLVDYSASKSAAYGFAEALRMEIRTQLPDAPIYSTTVCPMFVNTNLILGDEVKKRVSYTDRFGKLLEPRDVAEAVVDGALRNVPVVYVPSNSEQVNFTNAMLPDKARMALLDFLDTKFIPATKS